MAMNAFVYGTLMSNEIVTLLLRRTPESKPAVLTRYGRFRLKGRTFPAIVPAESQVKGLVLLNLSPRELWILDEYEADEYYRTTVQPVCEDGTVIDAEVYVWQEHLRHQLEDEPWDFEGFMRNNFVKYVEDMAPCKTLWDEAPRHLQ